ncbi:hypothetical protein HPC49_25600 [Pyxidicoccus fallax]|uniref:Uncharacterized protein n=1 Tax=Pyxidicoccus fallax TaxID=394095 RepID=A0A848LAJ7_9BACT|nr:hypothetical protein [Pyxidicoccus fallax]NMO15516.1 hypothetical protein [Pyxidicoccus fallax]NPC81588.1 hypothetical protein [Pyxidicoccus fallax]
MSNDPIRSEPATPEVEPSSGPQRRRTRRQLLLWALGLTPILAGGGLTTFRWKRKAEEEARAAPLTQAAAYYLFANHPEAGIHIEKALRESSTYAPALLLRACAELEAGNEAAARSTLAHTSLRDTPEAKLLLELATRRPDSPSVRQAFFDAWKALGHPDFTKSALLPEPLEQDILLADPEASYERANEAQRFALNVLTLDSCHKKCLFEIDGQFMKTTSVPLLVSSHEQVNRGSEWNLRELMLPSVLYRLRELTGPSPRSLQVALLFFFHALDERRPSALFNRGDLATLEKLLSIPEWKPVSNEQHFREMRALFDGLLDAPGHHAWRMVFLAQGPSLGMKLVRRAQASKDQLTDDEQQWLGRLLWEYGKRVSQERSHVELDLGIRLQRVGSELSRHVPDKEEVVDRWMELVSWEQAMARAGCYRWPLPSLQEDFYAARARDEDSWMKAFAGVGTLP